VRALLTGENSHFAIEQFEIEYSELTEANRKTAAEAERDNLDKVFGLKHKHVMMCLKHTATKAC
jgi:hypothetical protein